MISGIPQYHQEGIGYGVPCKDEEGIASGCGPVIGATVLAWWERRGVTGLMVVRGDGVGAGKKGAPWLRVNVGHQLIAHCQSDCLAPECAPTLIGSGRGRHQKRGFILCERGGHHMPHSPTNTEAEKYCKEKGL